MSDRREKPTDKTTLISTTVSRVVTRFARTINISPLLPPFARGTARYFLTPLFYHQSLRLTTLLYQNCFLYYFVGYSIIKDGDGMKKYKLIMTDLDNTLLPVITQDKFVQIWFTDVAKKFYDYGLNQAIALNAINEGCRAMILNNGKRRNDEVFYRTAVRISGYSREKLEEVLMDYYATTFENVRSIIEVNHFAPKIVKLIRERAQYIAVATMPLFPLAACDTRMRWTGISADMFDLVTSFDQSSYAKPNPMYFQEILDRFQVKPEEALMIGNDVREDMIPCQSLGIDVFLVTNHMITHDLDYSRFTHGTYEELIEYLKSV